MPATAAECCEDSAGGVACHNHAEIIVSTPGEMHRLTDEDVRFEPVVHGEASPHIVPAVAAFPASHSLSFVQRLRPETFFTAMATALACPTMTTSFLPRVMPV